MKKLYIVFMCILYVGVFFASDSDEDLCGGEGPWASDHGPSYLVDGVEIGSPGALHDILSEDLDPPVPWELDGVEMPPSPPTVRIDTDRLETPVHVQVPSRFGRPQLPRVDEVSSPLERSISPDHYRDEDSGVVVADFESPPRSSVARHLRTDYSIGRGGLAAPFLSGHPIIGDLPITFVGEAPPPPGLSLAVECAAVCKRCCTQSTECVGYGCRETGEFLCGCCCACIEWQHARGARLWGVRVGVLAWTAAVVGCWELFSSWASSLHPD